jgi:hypothetical protein
VRQRSWWFWIVVVTTTVAVMVVGSLIVLRLPEAWQRWFFLAATATIAALSFWADVGGIRSSLRGEEITRELIAEQEKTREVVEALPERIRDETIVALSHFTADSSSYGFCKEEWSACCELIPNGGARTKYRVMLSAITRDVPRIEYFVQNTLAFSGVGFLFDIGTEAATQASPIAKVRVKVSTHGPKRLAILEFEPPIPRGTSLTYSYATQAPPGSFAMTFEEVEKRRLEYEFRSRIVTYPTKHFYSKVIFPEGFEPIDTGYDVWFGLAKVRHDGEYYRIAYSSYWIDSHDELGRRYMQLNVDYPILGLRYVLKWVPPYSK